VAAVTLLQFKSLPVGTRHRPTAVACSAVTLHLEPFGARDGAVVEGGLLAGGRVSTGHDFERSGKPQGRVATVVGEVDRCAWWEDQMSTAVHGNRVDVRSIWIGVRKVYQHLEFCRRDEPAAEASHGRPGRQRAIEEQPAALDRRVPDSESVIDPDLRWRQRMLAQTASLPRCQRRSTHSRGIGGMRQRELCPKCGGLEFGALVGRDGDYRDSPIPRPNRDNNLRYVDSRNQLTQNYAVRGHSRDRADRFSKAEGMTELLPVLHEVATSMGLSIDDLISGGREWIETLLSLLPMDSIVRSLHRSTLPTNRQWEPNDHNDVVYLSAAAAYCDVVVGEREWIAKLRQPSCPARASHLFSKPSELSDLLDSRTA
jgi:hypothetical protein